MSDTLIERIAKSKAYTAKLEQQRRIQLRKEREAKKKKDQRRNYTLEFFPSEKFSFFLVFKIVYFAAFFNRFINILSLDNIDKNTSRGSNVIAFSAFVPGSNFKTSGKYLLTNSPIM